MANSTTLTGTTISIAAATDPSLCRISGYLKNVHGQSLAGAHLVLRYCYIPVGLGADTLLQQERIPIWADRHGYVQFDLLRGAKLTVELVNHLPWVFKVVKVPDAASAGLIEFLFPYVVSAAFEDPAPVTIDVGQNLLVRVLGTLSNGEVVTLPSSAVTLVSSNTNILAPFETVYFKGLSAGNADLTITAVDRDAVDLNQDREGNDLSFFDLPAVTLPGSPRSVTVA